MQLTANAEQVLSVLKEFSDQKKAEILSRFFKTGPGQYGEGDEFLGITVPVQRKIAKQFADIHLTDIESLLRNNFHECRLTAVLIMTEQFIRGDESVRSAIAGFYLSQTSRINNWDIVDLSCYKILGHYLENRNRKILYELANSVNLWEQRISIITTFHFIRNLDFEDTIKISEILLTHKHDLIHKAVGWMLREIGKRDIVRLRHFLDEHHKVMPRTMLRYSIEKLPEGERKKYMLRAVTKTCILDK